MMIGDNLGRITDVIVKQERYDELIRKEALLDTIKKLHGRSSSISFHDVVGHLLKTEGKTDE